MAELARAKDIMTKEVLAVGQDDSLDAVAKIFEKYDYDGLPVIDGSRRLVGIITAYDMVVQSSGMHLPTVVNIMEKISVNRADRKDLDEHFGRLKQITAKEIMNTEPLVVDPETNVQDIAKAFAEHHRVNPIPVVNGQGVLVGIVSRYDIIRFFNQQFLNQVVAGANRLPTRMKESEQEVTEAVGEISKEFLLVTKRRPRIWRYIAVAMFIAGLAVAFALIIRIVQQVP
ncbi:MAG: CBS domain-containing protein [Patescibacteria group bacterium]